MKIIAKNTVVLNSSFQFSEDRTEITYQANTELSVEGNPFPELFTPKTIFDLKCKTAKMKDIQAITETQVNEYVATKYLITE